jgi:hypothetical protein
MKVAGDWHKADAPDKWPEFFTIVDSGYII